MTIVRTYRVEFYDYDEEGCDFIDSIEFCASTPMEVRLIFVQWALATYASFPQILRVSQIYDSYDEVECNSDEYPEYEYDTSLAPDEEKEESDCERVRNELLTDLYYRMLTRGATKEEAIDFNKICGSIDSIYSSTTLMTMFSKYGYMGKDINSQQ